jgi:hypothetical protein
MILLNRKDFDSIVEHITSSMCHRQNNPDGSDMSCLFCHSDHVQTGPFSCDEVHKPDCEGNRLLSCLNRALTNSEQQGSVNEREKITNLI